ncbi:glycosyltransferase [Georgenia phoenicis]|uniref:glycosyltransferase n=1 Tax=unclassified Georgenia TaxID=2626815 RepID=UPI0039B06A52
MTHASTRPDVVHVSSVHSWSDNRVHYRECVTLADAGYRVSLVAVRSTTDAPRTAVELIELDRMPRALRVVLGSARAIAAGVRTKAPIVHLHDPELVWAIPLLRAMGRKVVYDAHEDLPHQVAGKAYIPRPLRPVAVAAAHLAVRVAALSNRVVAATPTIAAHFPKKDVTVVRNYPVLRSEEAAARPSHQRSKKAAYVGLIAPTRGARVMVDAAVHEAFPEDWRLTLAGPMSSELRKELEGMSGWGATDYKGQVPPDVARDLLLDAAVGFVLLEDKPAHRDALPTKMFEYLAAGLPVIASDFPLWREIVLDGDCGLVVDPASPSEVAEAVSRYANDPDLVARHSANGRRLAVEELNWQREGETLVGLYRELAAR